ncbi:MAG: hypothetical protein GXP42_18590 [Chloroflexi bacterium]|nr:hypothetical protein [Chloroflexota bacterium]
MTTCRIPLSPSTFDPPKPETEPPRIERLAVHPYPDLKRLWVRVQLTYFQRYPNVRLLCLDERGREVGEMLLVEWRDPYISLTMHLRRFEPGANYLMRVEVARDNQLLDVQEHPFQLVFNEVTE